jgi:glycine/D-amino acid oxidase-like deaminating enzyme
MGISGAMMAEALAAEGMSVVAIDRRGPVKGSTAATTALVQFEIDQPLSILSGKIGKDRAERAWRRSRLAVFNLKARIAELSIPCGATERQSLYLAGNVLDPGALREEGERRRAAGLHAIYLNRSALKERFGIDRDAALISAGNLALDPRRLTSGLHGAAAKNGARFYAAVEATGFETWDGKVAVATKGGPVITAGAIVLATGYELTDIVPPGGHQIISTWAIATRPQPKALWPEEAFIWEAADPYLYMRSTGDGRVICGGEDEEFIDEEKRDGLIPRKSQRIADKLARLFPKLDTRPEFAWTGSFGTTGTGLPIIGRLPRHPGIFAVMGYGGNGITFSQIASEIVLSALASRPDRDADLFAFAK